MAAALWRFFPRPAHLTMASADACQPPLVPRSGFQARLRPSVRLQSSKKRNRIRPWFSVFALARRLDPRGNSITTRNKGDRHEAHPSAYLGNVESGIHPDALPGLAADYPAPQEGSWVVHDFRFHTGEVLPELRLHYTTVGAPTGEPVLILHGTTESGANMLTPAFAGELFGPGQALNASRYYIILPDAIGTGKSSKPSDGLRANFPKYNYDDMVSGPIPAGHGALGRAPRAAGPGGLDGRHAHLALGPEISRRHGHRRADGVVADRDVRPQLDDTPSDHRCDPQRPGVDERQLHHTATQPQFASVFYGIATRRQSGTPEGGADTRERQTSCSTSA